MLTIVLLSLAGAVIAAIVGTLWYSNATPMGKVHMRYLGLDVLSPESRAQRMQAGKAMMPKMYAAQFALSFPIAFSVVFVITESLHNGLSFTLALGFVVFNWLCFMVPTIGAGILWSNCDRSIAWKKFFSDIFCSLVTILLVAFMTSFFA
jgi:hypothetical protein